MLEDDFGYLLLHVAAMAGRQADQILQERLGIGMSQYKLLKVVESNDSSVNLQRHLAESLGQTEASISRQIKLLVERGMVVADVSKQSRRSHSVTITDKGVQILLASQDILHKYFAETLADISPQKRAQLVEKMTVVHKSICDRGKFACHN